MKWREITLGSAIHVKHGYAFKGEFFAANGPFIVLTPGNFNESGGFRIRPEKDRAYVGDIPDGFLLKEDDLIVAMTEQGPGLLGSSAIVPEGNRYLHNQRLGLVDQIDANKLNKRFLYFLLNTRPVRGQINGSASGTKVRHTSPERICRVRVRVPDVKTQSDIADTLFAYDDLIENNRRRIQLLEEFARELYKEWFVRLRFPGHEHVKVVKGVPEGWQRKTAFDVMDVLSGGTPKTGVPDYWGGDIPFFTPKDTTNYAYVLETEKTLTELGLSKCNSKLYPQNTVFITARGTVGNLNLAHVPMAMNQSCYALLARPPLTQFFLYGALGAAIQQFKSRAVGAVFDAIIVDTFKAIPFTLPSASLLTQFGDVIEPIFQQSRTLATQTKKLSEARNLLLPRLMSGNITI